VKAPQGLFLALIVSEGGLAACFGAGYKFEILVNSKCTEVLRLFLLREYPNSECIDIPGRNARAFGH
jgi:hypothetical protein